MEKNYIQEERWLLAKSNSFLKTEQDEYDHDYEDDEEEEALSLCDLPTRKENEENTVPYATINEAQEDFNFCRSLSNESEMCSADEVFFKGQILPLRNSVSSEKGLIQFYPTRSISRSESMDHYCSGGLVSSRSSSTSSGSSAPLRKQNPKPPRNQFHSHPSPSPKISRFPNNKQKSNLNTNNYKISTRKSVSSSSTTTSTVWSIFRLGLVTPPPEIAFGDFKTRNLNNSKNSGSRNSTSTNSSESIKNVKSGEKKKKKSMARLLGGGSGCKCSIDAVETVPSRVVIMKRSQMREEEEEEKAMMKLKSPKKMMKKQISYHRTFEWLKQLSIEAGGGDD